VFLNGHDLGIDCDGETLRDDTFGILFNARHEEVTFTLPREGTWGQCWVKVLDTRDARFGESKASYEAGAQVKMEALSVAVLRRA
jgi:glycogen operon protein